MACGVHDIGTLVAAAFIAYAFLTDRGRQTVQYLERLLAVRDAAASALLTLGDGNWKMGQGTTIGKTKTPGEVDERTVLEHFTCTSPSSAQSGPLPC